MVDVTNRQTPGLINVVFMAACHLYQVQSAVGQSETNADKMKERK